MLIVQCDCTFAGERVHEDRVAELPEEANTSQPDLRYVRAVIRFLTYNPLPEAKTLGERIVRHRTAMGMSQKEPRYAWEWIRARWQGGSEVSAGPWLHSMKLSTISSTARTARSTPAARLDDISECAYANPARLAAQRFRIDSDSRFRPAGVIPPTRDFVMARLFRADAFLCAQ